MAENLLKLAFVGDVCLGFFRRAPLRISDFTGWPTIRDKLDDPDLLVGNLECCLVDATCREEARSNGMAVPATAGTFLREVGFTDLCLANNHAMDGGAEAVPVTRARLAAHGIRRFGVGSNLAEAEEVDYAEVKGRTVAFLGACDQSEYYARGDRAGVAPLNKQRLGRRVRTAARQADLVVVTLHADLEFSNVPGSWRRRLSRWLIDQGAHMVIQHHPHVLQGFETYRGGVIAYSLGNFIFRIHGNRYQERHAGVLDSLVLGVDVNFAHAQPELVWRVVPLRIGADHLPHVVTGSGRDDVMQQVQNLSATALDRRAHRRAWFGRCQTEAVTRMLHVYYASHHGHLARGARELGHLFTCREDRRWLLGLASLGYL